MKRALLAALALSIITGGTWLFVRARADSPPAVPTMTVKIEPFTRRITAEGNFKAVKATPVTPPRVGAAEGPRPMKIAWMTPDGSRVEGGQVVLRFDPTELERQLRDGQADLAAARAKLERQRVEAGTVEKGRSSTAELAEKELDKTQKFQNKDEEIFSRHQIIESRIDGELSRAKMEHARAAEQIEKRLTRSKMGLIEVEQRKAELVIQQARAGLESLEVKAPHAGILVFKRDWRGELPREGEQVWPGETIAEIPLLDEMEAEVFALEVDGGGLKVDTPARVVVEARPGVEYAGHVKQVDGLARPRVHGSPIQYFSVVVALDRTDKDAMKPGQRVRATLILDREKALLVPRQAIRQVDGRNVVYRLDGDGRFTPVAVELGAGTPGRVVIEKGLAAGDRIALRDPTRSLDQALAGDRPASGQAEAR